MAIIVEYKDLSLEYPFFTDLVLEGILASPEVESNDLAFSNRNGLIPGNDRTRGRNISITGTIVAFNEASFNNAVMELRRAFQVGIPSERELILQMPGLANGNEVAIACKPRRFAGLIDPNYDNWTAGFRVDLFATNGSFYSPISAYHLATLLTDTTPAGHGFPLSFPHGFGGGGSNLTVINNAGNVDSYPNFTVYGPLNNFSLINQTTNETISFEIVLGASDYLEINSTLRTVTINGGASRFNTLRDSEWWALAPGNNSILFDVTSTTGTPHTDLVWRDGWS